MISTEKRENVIGSEKECEICGKFFVGSSSTRTVKSGNTVMTARQIPIKQN